MRIHGGVHESTGRRDWVYRNRLGKGIHGINTREIFVEMQACIRPRKGHGVTLLHACISVYRMYVASTIQANVSFNLPRE